MALTTGQQIQANQIVATRGDYILELRTADATDLTPSEKAQLAAIAGLTYPLADPASNYDTYVAEIRSPGSTGLSAGIKAQLASTSTLSVDFVPALRSTQTAPAVVSAPIILGTPQVGVLTYRTAGVFTGWPTPTITYQWLADDVEISGATSATYTPVTGDIGAVLKVTETATNAVDNVTSTSAGSPAVLEASGTLVFSEDWSTIPDFESSEINELPMPGSSWDAGFYGPGPLRFEDYPHMLPPSQVKGDDIFGNASINTTTNVITSAGHGRANDSKIWLDGTSLPTSTPAIETDIYVFVINQTTDTFQLSRTIGGTAIDFSDTGTNVVWHANNPLWFRTPGGRSWINTRDSFPTNSNGGYVSDLDVTKDVAGSVGMYCKAFIKFSPDWVRLGLPDIYSVFGNVKCFRCGHWNGLEERYEYFQQGNTGPMYIWNWYHASTNAATQLAIRGAPQSPNYYVIDPTSAGYDGRSFISGDMYRDFTTNCVAVDAQIPDKVNGGLIPTSGSAFHDQIWGDDWNEVGWYVELNSAPGAADGKLCWWLNGVQIVGMGHIPWVGNTGVIADSHWNFATFGGNGFYNFAKDQWDGVSSVEREYQVWMAWSDIEIHNALPSGISMRITSGPDANYP